MFKFFSPVAGYPKRKRNQTKARARIESLETRTLLSDVSYGAVVKEEDYSQTGSTVLFSYFQASGFVKAATPTSVNSATMEMTDTSLQPLAQDPGTTDFSLDSATYSLMSALDAAVPNGTYKLHMSTAHDGNKTLTLPISGNNYPGAPKFTYADLVSPTATAPLTIHWSSYVGGTASDFINLNIYDGSDTNGASVFQSTDIDQPGALTGTATSDVVPTGTLLPSHTYTASLGFYKIKYTDTTGYHGVTGYAAYGAKTIITFTTAAPAGFVTNDFNADGVSDLLIRNKTNGTTGALLTGVNPNWQQLTGLQPAAWSILSTGDFNGDGKADMLIRNKDQYGVTGAILNNGTWVYFDALPSSTYELYSAKDINGDGVSDVIVRNKSNGAVLVYRVGLANPYQFIDTLPVASYDMVGRGDFNNDGLTDLAVQNTATGAVLYYQTGSINNPWHFLDVLDRSTYSVVQTADYNGDGLANLLVQNKNDGSILTYRTNTISPWLYLGSLPTANYEIVEKGDFNGDSTFDVCYRDINTGQVNAWILGANGVVRTLDLQATLAVVDWAII